MTLGSYHQHNQKHLHMINQRNNLTLNYSDLKISYICVDAVNGEIALPCSVYKCSPLMEKGSNYSLLQMI